jgi:hypothetical protein
MTCGNHHYRRCWPRGFFKAGLNPAVIEQVKTMAMALLDVIPQYNLSIFKNYQLQSKIINPKTNKKDI